MTFEQAIEKYVESLLTGDVMTLDAESANVEAVVQAWVLLKYTQDRLEGRLKSLRKVLLARAEEFGKDTETNVEPRSLKRPGISIWRISSLWRIWWLPSVTRGISSGIPSAYTGHSGVAVRG